MNSSSEVLHMEKYFLIIDECGWRYYIKTDNPDIANLDLLLVPHVRSAFEITKSEFEEGSK